MASEDQAQPSDLPERCTNYASFHQEKVQPGTSQRGEMIRQASRWAWFYRSSFSSCRASSLSSPLSSNKPLKRNLIFTYFQPVSVASYAWLWALSWKSSCGITTWPSLVLAVKSLLPFSLMETLKQKQIWTLWGNKMRCFEFNRYEYAHFQL